MAFDNEDKRENASEPSDTVQDAIVDALGEALKDPDDDEGPRDSIIGRWAKFVVIMVALGLVVGGLAAAWTYNFPSSSNFRHRRPDMTPMTDQQWNDLKHDVRRNAIVGFVLGAAIGGSYVIKCLVRGVDP